MVISTPSAFAAGVAEYAFAELTFEPEVLARASRSLEQAGLFVVGEPHGVCLNS